MQKASKTFDEQIEIINRIKNPKKRKYQPHKQPQYFHTYQLPTITNTLRNFHKQQYSPSSHNSSLSSKKVQTELDNIINGALMHYKNQKINKIIFATPISNRLNLGKTYYRSTRANSIDQEPLSYRSQEKQPSPRRRIKQSFNLRSLRLMKENQELAKLNSVSQENQFLDIVGQNKIAEQFGMFYTTPEQARPLPTKKMRKTFVRPQQKQKKQAVRYSPWRNQDDDEILL